MNCIVVTGMQRGPLGPPTSTGGHWWATRNSSKQKLLLSKSGSASSKQGTEAAGYKEVLWITMVGNFLAKQHKKADRRRSG